MSRLLLHICCAPCLCHPYRVLSAENVDFTGFWYNPNIHPYKEYQARLQSVKHFTLKHKMPAVFWDEYPLEKTLELLSRERCNGCYRLRLEETARQAKAQGFQDFSSTLLYSIYQKHDLIRELGTEAGKKYGVEFLYHDFRSGWEEGHRISMEENLYRQKYCGCIFSERDRYQKAENKNRNQVPG
jgi:predicted adenine nucleotide alpha hydrolase (AANH) superfamily ATPase